MSAGSGVGLVAMTEEEFAAELHDLCVDTAPHRFALCGVQECEDGEVIGWGLAVAGWAVVCSPRGHRLGDFGSAETAHRLFSRLGLSAWSGSTPPPTQPPPIPAMTVTSTSTMTTSETPAHPPHRSDTGGPRSPVVVAEVNHGCPIVPGCRLDSRCHTVITSVRADIT